MRNLKLTHKASSLERLVGCVQEQIEKIKIGQEMRRHHECGHTRLDPYLLQVLQLQHQLLEPILL